MNVLVQIVDDVELLVIRGTKANFTEVDSRRSDDHFVKILEKKSKLYDTRGITPKRVAGSTSAT